MTEYAVVRVGELFQGMNGRAKFNKDYLDAHSGEYPVYSASLTRPFGYVDEFEYSGNYLTWVMNGYGGRVQEVSGEFSVNRDRGVFVPLEGVQIPDLTYLRFAMEPELVASAIGRRVDGRRNDYTKIYPDTAMKVSFQIPLNGAGRYDYEKMSVFGSRFRRIERAQGDVRIAMDALQRASFSADFPEPAITIGLSDSRVFALSIGKRVLRNEQTEHGIPVYSANALMPFGKVTNSNLSDFGGPSMLWGIDGNFDWNMIPAGEVFATTDHCGRLRILDESLDPDYVFQFLRATRDRYGFDRVYRASLENMKAEVRVSVPIDVKTGAFAKDRQRRNAQSLRNFQATRKNSIAAMDDVLKARIGLDL